MRVTVCELPNDILAFKSAWSDLANHVQVEKSDLVLLPEMPFSKWFANTPTFCQESWDLAVTAHQKAEPMVEALNALAVAYSRPVTRDGKRLNEGVLFQHGKVRSTHFKYYLPNEEPVWERSWYQRGEKSFQPFTSAGVSMGFLICTELWFFARARELGEKGTHLILTPRKTDSSTLDKWLVAGKAAAISAGAFSLSSNTHSLPNDKDGFGGGGWIIDPEGKVLGTTDSARPFLTMEIDIERAVVAKSTYPRNVDE